MVRSYVARILDNPFYHGVMIVKEKEYPHRYPPIITKSLFDQVHQIKKGHNKKPHKFAGLPYIYRGMIRCGDCGLAVTPEKHKGHVYYHCTEYKGKHGAKWFREETITEEIGKVFKSFEMPKEVVEQIVETLNSLQNEKAKFHEKELNRLNTELKSYTKMMDNLYLDKRKGRITDSEYDRFYQTLRDQVLDINIRLDQLQEAEDNYVITSKYLLDLASRAYELFIGSEVEEKRQLIKLVLSNLRIEGEKLLWELHPPLNLIAKCSEDLLWLGRKDSNLRMPGPKPGALPLGDAPIKNFEIIQDFLQLSYYTLLLRVLQHLILFQNLAGELYL